MSSHVPPEAADRETDSKASDEQEEGELFRREVLEEQGNKVIGEVILLWTPMLKTVVIAYSLAALIVSIMLIFGKYQQKERVPGILVPGAGIVSINAETAGRMQAVLVEEGQVVHPGQALLSISRESFLRSEEGKATLQLDEMNQDLQRWQGQLDLLDLKQDNERSEIMAKITAVRQSQAQSQEIILLKSRQRQEAQKSFDASQRLFEQKIIARSEFEQQLANLSNIKQSIAEEQRRLAETRSSLRELQLEGEQLSQVYETKATELQSHVSTLRQRIVESESQKEVLIKAPIEGLVSGVRVDPGQAVEPGSLLMKLVPRDLQLEAHLFLSSRAAPFVKEGQRVWLQFESLSPTKYGVFPAEIASISQTTINPEDIRDIKLDAPRYLLRVKLDEAALSRAQGNLNLKAGLLLEADILMGRRSLLEWIAEPMLRTRGSDAVEEP